MSFRNDNYVSALSVGGAPSTGLGHSNKKALGPSSAPAPRGLACLTQEGCCLAVECDLGALAIHTQRKEATGLGAAGRQTEII